MRSDCRWMAQLTMLGFGLSSNAPVFAQSGDQPFEATAKVPDSRYESVFAGANQNYKDRLDAPLLPWKSLYQADGTFTPQSRIDALPHSVITSEESIPATGLPHDSMNHDATVGAQTPSHTTDARGVVQKIYLRDAKLKMKHGPIDKLSMPGMTMIFYLKDRALMDGLQEGEEVGFDVELDGTTFYIIGIDKP